MVGGGRALPWRGTGSLRRTCARSRRAWLVRVLPTASPRPAPVLKLRGSCPRLAGNACNIRQGPLSLCTRVRSSILTLVHTPRGRCRRTIAVESSAAAKSASAYVGLHCHDRLITYANENGTVTCVSRDDAGNTTEITAAPQANVMKVCEEKPNLFAIGGTDSEVRIWDINDAAKPVFKAKNVKPDKLFLQALKCVKSIDFMPGSDGSQIVTGTAYKELRLYDSKAKLRPMFK